MEKVLRFDGESLKRNEIRSTAELQSMKCDLDGLTELLASGKATTIDKENAKMLNESLKTATKLRSVSEKAVKIDTAALMASIKKDKAVLSEKLASLKDAAKSDEERAGIKADCVTLKDTIKDSIEIAEVRKRLEKRTDAKVGIETRIENNLESARKARKIVLCFMMDCTGSMQSCIDEVKTKIRDVASKFSSLYAESNIYYSFLGYRDFNDSEPFMKFNFVEDVAEFQDYVQGVTADGGGDEAEDVVGALNEAKDLNWDIAGPGSSRILIHVADAPAHGSKYHEADVSDDYENKDPPGGAERKNATPALRYLKAKKVHFFFCPPPGHKCDKMVRVFNSDLNTNYVEMRELAAVHNLSDTVLKTLSTSVMLTQASARQEMTHKLYSLGAIPEDDDDGSSQLPEPEIKASTGRVSLTSQPSHTVKVYAIKPPTNLTAFQSAFVPIRCQVMHDGRDGTAQMKWQESAFAKGSIRWAFYGELLSGDETEQFVMKRFQGDRHKRESYMSGIEEACVAQFLAEQFTGHNRAGLKKVRYLNAYVLELQRNPHEYFFGEVQLPDLPFGKWANNAGDWDLTILNQTMLEFAKFTYDATDGYLMVSDLQGVEAEDEFILTDPVVLCRDTTRFPPTNLGPKAMQANYEKVKVLLSEFL